MAEKLIRRPEGDWEPEDVGADYISKLEARNLIQVAQRRHDGRVKKFRVHDLLHSFCVDMGREINFLNTDDHLESSSAKRVRRLSVHHRSIAESAKLISQMTKLRALFHFKFDKKIEIKCLDNMLGKFKLLQVLKISVYLEVANIPFQIGSLRRLSYLEIYSQSPVKIPSSIRDLKNLHTLDLKGCQHEVKLPIEIWKMEQLTHLFLYNYVIHFYPMWQLCKYQQVQVLLPNLQTLSGICFDLEPASLLKFTNLSKLELVIVTPEIMEVLCGPEPISKKLEVLSLCGWFLYDNSMNKRGSLAKYERLMKLTIDEVKMQQLPELPPSLIKLTLKYTNLIEDPMNILKNLPKLKILNLYYDSYLGSKLDCSGADSFPQLEILQLRFLEELEELIEGEEMGMPKLKQLFIRGCPELVQIPERLQQLWMKN